MITISIATKEDLDQVITVLKRLETEHYSRTDKEAIIRSIDSENIYVARLNQQVVGVAQIEPAEGSWEIYALSVMHSRKGVGRALVAFLEEQARQQGIIKIWCWSLARYGAVDFYRKMGFTEEFLLRKQWFKEDCWILGKLLDGS